MSEYFMWCNDGDILTFFWYHFLKPKYLKYVYKQPLKEHSTDTKNEIKYCHFKLKKHLSVKSK